MMLSKYLFAEPLSWKDVEAPKFICPVPGFDRHFRMLEDFGIEMINVDMNADGPDMDQVEAIVAEDESVKGIWIVPKYGNPTGISVSDEVVDRLAKMKTSASDFRIFWDNAYTVHHLSEDIDEVKNLFRECISSGNPDRVYIYGSTSKITFACM